jgi:hypothetical protein
MIPPGSALASGGVTPIEREGVTTCAPQGDDERCEPA